MGGDAVCVIILSVLCACGLHSVGFVRVTVRVRACVGDGARRLVSACAMFQVLKV